MDKEHLAIWRIQQAAKISERVRHEPLLITYSGGKDSQVLVHLAEKSGISFEVVNSHTTADAPETVRFIRAQFADMERRGIKCTVLYPYYKGKRTSMWALIPQKLMPPTRSVRYCCQILKETTPKERHIATGVRWAESARRKNSRGIMEQAHRDPAKRIIFRTDNDVERESHEGCSLKGQIVTNPIIDWTDDEIWDYIRTEKLPINPLYCEGWTRVGCIGCPLARRATRQKEFARWPKYEQMYIRAFDAMLEEHIRQGKRSTLTNWQTGHDVFHWWMDDGVLPGQMEMEDYNG